jgi:hypothetical protein
VFVHELETLEINDQHVIVAGNILAYIPAETDAELPQLPRGSEIAGCEETA